MPLRRLTSILAFAVLIASAPAAGRAELPPFKTYTPADGLAALEAFNVVQDSRGFLWFCTGDGLSRFDGYAMTTYTTRDGLPDRRTGAFLETKAGEYWVGTAGGLCRLDARSERRFTRVALGDTPASNDVDDLVELDDGTVLVGTDDGLFRIRTNASGDVDVSRVPSKGNLSFYALCRGSWGRVWVGSEGVVRCLEADGSMTSVEVPGAVSDTPFPCIYEDASGRLWVGTRGGMWTAEPTRSASEPVKLTRVTSGAPPGWINSFYETRAGDLLVATTGGIWRRTAPGATTFEPTTHFKSACDRSVWSVAEDRDGVLWAASECGVIRLETAGFTRYTMDDGLGQLNANSIFATRAGDLVVTTNDVKRIERFDGTRFVSVASRVPPSVTYFGWGWSQIVAQDTHGNWYVAVGTGLLRYPPADRPDDAVRSLPVAHQFDREAFRVFADSRGGVWTSLTNTPALMYASGVAATPLDVTSETGGSGAEYVSFAETRDGAVWIGRSDGRLVRWADGRFQIFGADEGVPRGWLRYLFVDDAGRLWIATSLDGLVCIDDPTATQPSFAAFTMADGLSSDNVWTVTEDSWGRIYAGTPLGVDRVDLTTRRVTHLTSDDGLPKGKVLVSCRDAQGRLWFGTDFGIARFDPEPDREREAPRTLLVGLRVAGVARPISAVGEPDAGSLDLGPAENVVSVDFLGLGASLGEELRYQYRLEGSTGEWSAPSAERTVTFANLAPGSYRFFVRAVDADGRTSAAPASVAFSIAAPLWRRWWFLTLAFALVALAAYALYRYRLSKLLAVERVRTRIATDLHDDIGANLTKIAALSEVANFRLGHRDDALASIADISRESVAAMSDIVWAVNPGRDSLLDLARRMRQFANDVFVPRGIELRFDAHESLDLRLGDELRRQVYLVFKEAVSNAARHSNCAEADVSLEIEHDGLRLTVADDGDGFDPSADVDGNGLANMRRRAAAVRGALDVRSDLGRGTTVTLTVPLRPVVPPKRGG